MYVKTIAMGVRAETKEKAGRAVAELLAILRDPQTKAAVAKFEAVCLELLTQKQRFDREAKFEADVFLSLYGKLHPRFGPMVTLRRATSQLSRLSKVLVPKSQGGTTGDPGSITHEPDDEDAWICVCGNRPTAQGFYECDETGKLVSPDKNWAGLYYCDRCERIIDGETLETVGKRAAKS